MKDPSLSYYASRTVFLVPAVVLMIDSLVAIFWPVSMYIIVKMIIRSEEYLEHKFGEGYLSMKRWSMLCCQQHGKNINAQHGAVYVDNRTVSIIINNLANEYQI